MFRRIVICLPLTVFLLTVSSADAQQTGKVPRIGFLDKALLLVSRSSWRRSGRSCASLDGLKERISPSSIGLPSKSLNAYLSLRQTWFVLRLI